VAGSRAWGSHALRQARFGTAAVVATGCTMIAA